MNSSIVTPLISI